MTQEAPRAVLVNSAPPLQTNRFQTRPTPDPDTSRIAPDHRSTDFSDDFLDVRISAEVHDLDASCRGLRRKLRLEFTRGPRHLTDQPPNKGQDPE
jgi:hypothetical protein